MGNQSGDRKPDKNDLKVCNEVDPIRLVLLPNVPTKPGPSNVEQQDLLRFTPGPVANPAGYLVLHSHLSPVLLDFNTWNAYIRLSKGPAVQHS